MAGWRRQLLGIAALALACAPAPAQWPGQVPAAHAAQAGSETGLPLPRFASLGADRVNVRIGPGTRYPVTWVFLRQALPVEVIDEFDQWRRVRDPEGAEGWVHKAMLSGRPTVVVTPGLDPDSKVRTLHAAPRDEARPVARVEAGVLGRLFDCRGGWCEVAFGHYRGWMHADSLWGARTVGALH
jgi:SH3-like domain-containing protein